MGQVDTPENDFLRSLLDDLISVRDQPSLSTPLLSRMQISLHTAYPVDVNDQLVNEADYTGYKRVDMVNSRLVACSELTPKSAILRVEFPLSTMRIFQEITHFAISADGIALFSGELTPIINISHNVRPVIDVRVSNPFC